MLLESTVQKYRAELAFTTTSVTAKNFAIANLQEKIAELKEHLDDKDKKISQLETQLLLTFEDKQKTEKQFDALLDELENLDLTGYVYQSSGLALTGYVDQSSGLDLSGYVNYNSPSSSDILDKKQSFKKQPSRFSKFFDSIKNDKLPGLKRRLSHDNTFARVQSEHCYHRSVTHHGIAKPSELKNNVIEEEIPVNSPQHEDLSNASYKDSKESKGDSVKSQFCIIM
ncbi:hypothetical protein CHS0354_008554 [Potamilus streckersoni]|uniref:Uncharacterized protein n=1 Tax=Potamilus streckersoni TaxID=2493646 RepID=A0AAE0RS96_9BIVA|nr:hypothetical protein CHS0354_008554 [Potamilus streckersoni]